MTSRKTAAKETNSSIVACLLRKHVTALVLTEQTTLTSGSAIPNGKAMKKKQRGLDSQLINKTTLQFSIAFARRNNSLSDSK